MNPPGHNRLPEYYEKLVVTVETNDGMLSLVYTNDKLFVVASKLQDMIVDDDLWFDVEDADEVWETVLEGLV